MKKIVKNQTKIFFLFLFFIYQGVFANDTPTNPKKSIDKKSETTTSPIIASPEIQLQLDEALAKLNTELQSENFVLDKMQDLDLNVSTAVADARGDAGGMFSYLDQNPDKMKPFISFEDLVTLPVGFKQTLGDNSEIALGIYSVEYTPTGANVTAFARIKMKSNDPNSTIKERVLLLGATGITFTRTGGLGAGREVSLVLLGDFPVPMKNWTVIFKGEQTLGNSRSAKTFVTFDCGTFKGAGLDAEIVFPRSVIVPFDEITRTARTSTNERAKIAFTTAVGSGFNDVLINISSGTSTNNSTKSATFSSAFAPANMTKFGFKVINFTIDLSDTQNGNYNFPQSYKGDPLDLKWRGVYIQSLEILLPKEFNNNNSNVSLVANNVFVDRTGFTGKASYVSTSPDGTLCQAQKWPLNINRFAVEFVQNDFIGGGFGGTIRTPLNLEDTGKLDYEALIDRTGTYNLSVNVVKGNYPIKCWKARGKIYAGSRVELIVIDNQFYPSANLSGELNMAANTNDLDGEPGVQGNETVSFNGILFNNLALGVTQSEGFTFSVADFKYINTTESKLAKFPISITHFEKVNGTPTNDLWIRFGFKISLAGDKFSGSSLLTIKTHYNTTENKFMAGGSVDRKLITINSIYIKGTTSVMDLEGSVQFYGDGVSPICIPATCGSATLTDKGFCGSLNLYMKKPFRFGVEIDAIFGRNNTENYSYGFLSAYVGGGQASTKLKAVETSSDGRLTTKKITTTTTAGGFVIPTGFADIGINGVGMGIYFNMRPELVGTEIGYCPDRQVPFGFKLMLGIQNNALTGAVTPPTFTGRVNVDFALDRQYGINSIALSGVGVFTSSIVGDATTDLKKGVQNAVAEAGGDAQKLQNQKGVSHNQTALIAKAKRENNTATQKITDKGDITVALGVLLDVPNATFHAEAEVYVAKNNMVGIGEGNLAGRAVIHLERNNTYVHIGKQELTQRVGLKYKNNFEFGAYLMLGKGIGTIPLPPAEVIAFFPTIPARLGAINVSPAMAEVRSGNGFAVGAHIKANIDASGRLGYIRGYGVGGIDILLLTGNCTDANKLNGQMQIYGVGNINAGIGNRTLFNGGIGFYLHGTGFSPFNVTGSFCYTYGKKKKKLCISSNIEPTSCN
jgi:hypothetical protein